MIARHRISRYDAQDAGGSGHAQLAGPHNYIDHGPRDHRRADDRIRAEVSDRLTDDHSVDASDIRIHVQEGRVSLAGSVTSRKQRRRAEDVADRIGGVKAVTNDLRVLFDGENQSPLSNGRARPHPANAL